MREEEEVAKYVCRKWASKAEAVLGSGCLSLLLYALLLLLLLLIAVVVAEWCRMLLLLGRVVRARASGADIVHLYTTAGTFFLAVEHCLCVWTNIPQLHKSQERGVER